MSSVVGPGDCASGGLSDSDHVQWISAFKVKQVAVFCAQADFHDILSRGPQCDPSCMRAACRCCRVEQGTLSKLISHD
jgi:hypothetical protein